jgi:hypothetical protein
MYTTSRIWRFLLHEEEPDAEERADLQVGLSRLSPSTQIFFRALISGYSTGEAMGIAGLSGNQTRIKLVLLGQLTEAVNGTPPTAHDRPDIHGADEWQVNPC